MSERTFFTVRYASPGYTFILTILLITLPNLQKLVFPAELPINIELIATFLAVFTLLEGSAIGFLTSQVWYLFYNLFIRRFRLREARKFLQDTYGLTKRDLCRQTIFLDYVVFHSQKDILSYTQRRWDLLHTVGSTLFAIPIGSIFGFLIRIHLPATNITFNMPTPQYDFSAIAILIILAIFLIYGFWHVGKEHARMVEIVVRNIVNSGKFPPSKARKVFTEDYFR